MNYSAKDKDGKPLKRAMAVTFSLRGLRKRYLREATNLRIAIEKDALAKQNWNGRYEEGEHLRIFRGLPSVGDLAYEIEKKVRAAGTPTKPRGTYRNAMMRGIG
ncbi:hypothetical protein [Hyphomicrobium sp. MC8b]|uniref:hypothetical protein n=1 Tax=Hyphomicrobium sp. MC8b TaxID=300273 RepID=UPI00391D3C39